MRAALQVDVGRYEIRDVPTPEPGHGQYLIEVGACAICATDVKYFKGLQMREWPSPMGHEVTGVIAQAGPGATRFAPGERVLSRIVWGGFAEFVLADEDTLIRLPDGIGFEEGAIAQLLPIAVRGAELSVREGDSVFVCGLGAAGQLCAQVARAYGAAKVIVSDLHEMKRNVALELGADLALDPSKDDVVARVRDATGDGADVSMEAVGLEPAFRACEAAVRPGGTISVFGTHLEPISLSLLTWEGRSLQMNIMREQPHEMPALLERAVTLLAEGKVQLKPLLSRVMKLDDIMDAFDLAIHQPDRHIKISIVPR